MTRTTWDQCLQFSANNLFEQYQDGLETYTFPFSTSQPLKPSIGYDQDNLGTNVFTSQQTTCFGLYQDGLGTDSFPSTSSQPCKPSVRYDQDNLGTNAFPLPVFEKKTAWPLQPLLNQTQKDLGTDNFICPLFTAFDFTLCSGSGWSKELSELDNQIKWQQVKWTKVGSKRD